ncbi:CBF-domain-containing protein [Lichtheimia hyalospora FSU 10163]|nr:CBF-domain-containing protein [Lichtheimia hyalospora FSU 10163]
MPDKAILEPTSQWYTIELAEITPNDVQLSAEKIAEKKSYAKQLLKKENELVDLTGALSTSDRNFVSNILASGTLNDKVSALTLLVQESPVHSLKTMDTMLAMSKKKGRKEAVMALESLKDLFLGSVLPDRKLKYFADQPLAAHGVKDKHLVLWYFEDHLKKYYYQLVQQIEALSHDPLVHVRMAMIRCIHDLLVGKPEQEQNLLKLLVNKLGDSENKVAAKASQFIIDLLVAHPGMKPFVVREVEQLLLLPDVSERAQYYSLITLNQTILTAKDTGVANKLIEIYFIFFRRLLNLVEQEEENGDVKLVPVNDKKKKNKKKGGKHGKKKPEPKKNTEEQMDEVRSKMIAAILTGVNRAFHFAKIADEIVERHLEILYKITHTAFINTAIQALSLIFTISLSRQFAADRFYRTLYESLLDTRLLTTSKQTMYLNLLFKAIRADTDLKRIKAFVKRMLQIAGHHQPPFICGVLYLLSQLTETHPGLKAMLTTAEEDDEEEHFEDAPSEEDEEDNDNDKSDKKPTQNNARANYYDGRKRDPRFSKAETSCLWELIPFRNHYHPSVAKFANMLFNDEKIAEQSDMHNFTLIHFLDRFVYRNPKKATTTRGKSIMQPLPGRQDGGILMTRGTQQEHAVPVNSEAFWRKKIEDVPVDEIFFHKYFQQKRAGEDLDEESSKKKRKLEGEDLEDEQNEDEVWRAMMSSIPGGLDDDDEDIDNVDDDEDDFDDDEMRALLEDDDDEDDGVEGLEQDSSDDDQDIMDEDDEQDEENDDDDDDEGITVNGVRMIEAPSSDDEEEDSD